MRIINNGTISIWFSADAPLPEGFELGRLPSAETIARKEKFKALSINSDTGRKKKVLCIELNRVFESGAEAKRELGVSPTKISLCCHGHRNTAGGYHWVFVEEDMYNGNQ